MDKLVFNEVYFSEAGCDDYYKMVVEVYDTEEIEYKGSIIQDLTSSEEFYFDDELLANANLVNTSSLDLNEMKYLVRLQL